MTKVAVVGTGRMGSALARALLRAEHDVHVFNRTTARAEPLRTHGATLHGDVPSAVSAAQVVFVCVQDYTSANALLRTPEVTRALARKTLVQLGSGSPREAREGATWARAHDVRYLDGAIMATPDFIGTPGCTVLYAGERAHFDDLAPLLAAFGGAAEHVDEDVGAASALDSALLAAMWGELFGILQGAAVAEAEHIALDTYARLLPGLKPVTAGAGDEMVGRIARKHYAADASTLASLASHHGAFLHLHEIVTHHALNDALSGALARLFDAAAAGGHAGDDFTTIYRVMQAARARE